ncbi:type I-E CRISPR-associated protein Cse1/CasA [Pseudarthrobacter sp. AB1]|uniref:type I-E CRISPR-associated protein Cse1/CasA n=1 Tax=Pseudarthrobacter sp. AB1 TaxID=2138309 RepID=UPI00186B75AB|nr:type I-E CRISPR-associated protein Cse1/CasA [Pseudarthrobacter sp. AB1]MBE4719508.1 hypothetical protein [Pseudarthrobacter sp. AB1]
MIEESIPGCALSGIPWIRTTDGPLTVREVLTDAHRIQGIDTTLNGIQVGAQLRFLTAVAALIIRRSSSTGSFSTEGIDAVLGELAPRTSIFDPERPFLQVPAGTEPVAAGDKTPVKKLYPWMPADRAEAFWSANTVPKTLDPADAVLALAVHYHYSFGGNNSIGGRSCVNGSPGIRYPGVGFTATEVLWQGKNLFETILMNTPTAWVSGEGLPVWADPSAARSMAQNGQVEHPLWRATWGSNTAQCLWVDGTLTAVSTGGSPHLPPTAGAGKDGAKAWWDQRNTEDSFYLYVDVEKTNAAGVVTDIQRKMQRLDLGRYETDLAVEWNAKGLSQAVRSRSKATVLPPGRESQLIFLRHLVEGSASSPVVRRTEVLVSSPKKWMVAEERAHAVADAALMIRAACAAVTAPFTMKGRLTALRDRRTDVETAFWIKVSPLFEKFITNGTGEEIDAGLWPLVRRAAMEAFDEVTATAPAAKLAPFIMTARGRVAMNVADVLGLRVKKMA